MTSEVEGRNNSRGKGKKRGEKRVGKKQQQRKERRGMRVREKKVGWREGREENESTVSLWHKMIICRKEIQK